VSEGVGERGDKEERKKRRTPSLTLGSLRGDADFAYDLWVIGRTPSLTLGSLRGDADFAHDL
jgi:hypothetical protein